MTSTEIRTLLQPPNIRDSDARVLAYLNSTFKSVDDLERDADLDALVEESRAKLEKLETKVRLAPSFLARPVSPYYENTSHHTPAQLSSHIRRSPWTA